ncbi:MAG: YdcF family protein [Flavobacteriales bacterium]|nr:YdcF family protein [Flavobacteriales bacterium]
MLRTNIVLAVTGCLVCVPIIATLISERLIKANALGRSFDSTEEVPHHPVALVLGTAAGSASGRPNAYFVNRVQAAAALYHAGKVDHLLLSGDNGIQGYNEPMDMRRSLMDLGVDSNRITLDFAGFDTYDSVVRAKRIFGQERLVIVSQRFHNERALYIARASGIDAIGFNAEETGITRTAYSWVRERGARLKMWTDILLGVDPYFLGEPVTLGEQVLPASMR